LADLRFVTSVFRLLIGCRGNTVRHGPDRVTNSTRGPAIQTAQTHGDGVRRGLLLMEKLKHGKGARRINQHLGLVVRECKDNYCTGRPLVGRHGVLYGILYKREILLCGSNVARFGKTTRRSTFLNVDLAPF